MSAVTGAAATMPPITGPHRRSNKLTTTISNGRCRMERA